MGGPEAERALEKKLKEAPFIRWYFSPPWMGAEPSLNIERTKRSSGRAILRRRCSTSKKVRSRSPSFPSKGKEAVVSILSPDEFCGEGCLTRAGYRKN